MAEYRSKEAGFTLIELLVAITILGFIMLALLGGLRFGTRVWDRSERHMSNASDIARVQALLRRELSTAYPAYIVVDPTHGHIDFVGHADGLEFLGPAPQALSGAGRARIGLRVQHSADGMSLIFEASPELAADPKASSASEVLLSRLKELKFSYFGQNGAAPATWADDWSNQTQLPKLIRIEASFEDGVTQTWPSLVVAPIVTVDVTCTYDALNHGCAGR